MQFFGVQCFFQDYFDYGYAGGTFGDIPCLDFIYPVSLAASVIIFEMGLSCDVFFNFLKQTKNKEVSSAYNVTTSIAGEFF